MLSTYVSVYIDLKTHSRILQSTKFLTTITTIVPTTSVITYSVELSSKLGNPSLTLSIKYEVLITNGTKNLSQNYPPVDTIQRLNASSKVKLLSITFSYLTKSFLSLLFCNRLVLSFYLSTTNLLLAWRRSLIPLIFITGSPPHMSNMWNISFLDNTIFNLLKIISFIEIEQISFLYMS